MELPQYTLHHTIKRMVIPRLAMLLVLAPAFYLGIWINARLLNIDIPGIVAVLIIIVLIVMVAVQSILNYISFQKFKYLFYTNRVEYEGSKPQTFLYTEFSEAKLKQNLFDKMFNTGSIELSKSFAIGPISNVTQIKTYLEQLVQYYRFTQQRYKIQQAEQNMKASTTSSGTGLIAGAAYGSQAAGSGTANKSGLVSSASGSTASSSPMGKTTGGGI